MLSRAINTDILDSGVR